MDAVMAGAAGGDAGPGATGEAGSARRAELSPSPLSLAGSIFAADLALSDALASSELLPPAWAGCLPSAVGALFAGSSLSGTVLASVFAGSLLASAGSSTGGFPLLLSRCLDLSPC